MASFVTYVGIVSVESSGPASCFCVLQVVVIVASSLWLADGCHHVVVVDVDCSES